MVFPGTTLHMECLFMKVNCESGDQLLTQLLDVRHTIMDLPQHHCKVTPPSKIRYLHYALILAITFLDTDINWVMGIKCYQSKLN